MIVAIMEANSKHASRLPAIAIIHSAGAARIISNIDHKRMS